MNYCPTCGKPVGPDGIDNDVSSIHFYYECECGRRWEETQCDDDKTTITLLEEAEDGEGG